MTKLQTLLLTESRKKMFFYNFYKRAQQKLPVLPKILNFTKFHRERCIEFWFLQFLFAGRQSNDPLLRPLSQAYPHLRPNDPLQARLLPQLCNNTGYQMLQVRGQGDPSGTSGTGFHLHVLARWFAVRTQWLQTDLPVTTGLASSHPAQTC